MCLKTQKDCIRGNPPLVCCALNLFIFLVLLVSGGFYIISKPVEKKYFPELILDFRN
jgi:hypothetical protein